MNRARGHVCRPTRPPQHQETSVGPSPPCVRMPTATLKALFSRVQFRTEKCSRKPGGRGSDVCDRQRSAGPNLPVRRFSPHVLAIRPNSRNRAFGPFLPLWVTWRLYFIKNKPNFGSFLVGPPDRESVREPTELALLAPRGHGHLICHFGYSFPSHQPRGGKSRGPCRAPSWPDITI